MDWEYMGVGEYPELGWENGDVGVKWAEGERGTVVAEEVGN